MSILFSHATLLHLANAMDRTEQQRISTLAERLLPFAQIVAATSIEPEIDKLSEAYGVHYNGDDWCRFIFAMAGLNLAVAAARARIDDDGPAIERVGRVEFFDVLEKARARVVSTSKDTTARLFTASNVLAAAKDYGAYSNAAPADVPPEVMHGSWIWKNISDRFGDVDEGFVRGLINITGTLVVGFFLRYWLSDDQAKRLDAMRDLDR